MLSQDYADIEYIVVDPGSTDGSREIIDSYGDKIIKIFSPDSGPADGLNKGFEVATGDIYGFLNSDDTLCPKAISAAVTAFREFAYADVVYGKAYIIDQDQRELRALYPDRPGKTRFAYGGVILPQPSVFFRANCFRLIGGFNEENRSNWDGELFLRFCLADFKFMKVNAFLSSYRLHNLSITQSGSLNDLHNDHQQKMLRMYLGRDLKIWDFICIFLFKWLRKILNPLDTIERIRRGPIYNRR